MKIIKHIINSRIELNTIELNKTYLERKITLRIRKGSNKYEIL